MSTSWAKINRILPFSYVDGPGNRFVIFFQGCNLKCLSCHNPYTMHHCNDCGICVETCPDKALSIIEGKVIWTEASCSQCDKCIDVCPHNASPKIQHYHINDILEQINHYLPFLTGITVSGGESTLQLAFIHNLFKTIKTTPNLSHLTCLVDSNGTLSQIGWEKLLPVMDGAMVDLKAWEAVIHEILTGRSNQSVKESIILLAKHNKLDEIRLLIIPDKTDLISSINLLIEFFSSLPQKPQIPLNVFNNHGVKADASTWALAKRAMIGSVANTLEQNGFKQLILPSVYING